MKKNSLFSLICVVLCGLIAPHTVLAATQINPGTYEVKSDYMAGDIVISITNGGKDIETIVSLVNPNSGSDAYIEGPATIKNGKITISSYNEYTEKTAQVTITFKDSKNLTIEQNDEAYLFAGVDAIFAGDYKYTYSPPKWAAIKERKDFKIDNPQKIIDKAYKELQAYFKDTKTFNLQTVKKAKYYIHTVAIPDTKDKWIYVMIEDRSTGQVDDYFNVGLSWPSLEMYSVGSFILGGDSFENHLNMAIDDWYMFD